MNEILGLEIRIPSLEKTFVAFKEYWFDRMDNYRVLAATLHDLGAIVLVRNVQSVVFQLNGKQFWLGDLEEDFGRIGLREMSDNASVVTVVKIPIGYDSNSGIRTAIEIAADAIHLATQRQ